jgi:hypothetical protein
MRWPPTATNTEHGEGRAGRARGRGYSCRESDPAFLIDHTLPQAWLQLEEKDASDFSSAAKVSGFNKSYYRISVYSLDIPIANSSLELRTP